MTKGNSLLVSVRSAEEAALAMHGGADLIDVKEPARGSLGKADDAVISEIVHCVSGLRPVSAAMGELLEAAQPQSNDATRLDFLKWGLAGCQAIQDWQARLSRFAAASKEAGIAAQIVFVAYADWEAAQAPPVFDVVDFACRSSQKTLLIDTYRKSKGHNLMTCLSKEDLTTIRQQCREHQVQLAIAGSLGLAEIADLLDVQPDWFAVRGAVCREGRQSTIDPKKIRRIADLIAGLYRRAGLRKRPVA